MLQASFSPDGSRVLTLAEGNTASLWEAGRDGVFGRPLTLRDALVAAEFSPDGERLLTVSGPEDGQARLWDAMTGRPLSEPMVHLAPVLCARFSPDGKRVIIGARDGATTWWEVPRPPVPAPRWLPELALLLAAGQTAPTPSLGASALHRLRKLRTELEMSPANDFYGQWDRWYFGDGFDRPAAPFAQSTVLEYLEYLMFGRSPPPLLEVVRFQPTNAIALSRLAAMSRHDELRTNATLMTAVHHQITRLAERDRDHRDEQRQRHPL